MNIKNMLYIAGAFVFLGVCSTAQLKSQENKLSTGIAMFIHPPAGETLGNLKGSDFEVSQGAKQISVTVHRPTVDAHKAVSADLPTHVLVIIDQRMAGGFANRGPLMHKLESIWHQGFLTSVQLPGLQASPFVSSVQEAQRVIPNLPHATDPMAESAQAIKSMNAFAGRKVLLYVIGENGMNAEKIPSQLTKIANAAMVQVYVVDGGRPSGSFDYFGPITRVKGSSPSTPPAETELGFIPKVSYPAQNMFSSGIFHEIDLGTAIKKVIADSSNYFDLSLQCATPACFNPKLPILIKIRKPGPLRVTAEGYGLAAGVVLEAEAK